MFYMSMCHNLEDPDLNIHHHENLQSHIKNRRVSNIFTTVFYSQSMLYGC